MISERWDVVVVPFPFAEGPGEKRRPALALSSRDFNRAGHTILAMITTATCRNPNRNRPPNYGAFTERL